MTAFARRLREAQRRARSLLCIGLDPDPARMPVPGVAEFNRAVIEATADLVCAYKPNLAFYEALGLEGLRALEQTLRAIPPGVLVIGDAKRGDVPSTARFYARALFEVWGFDAVTVNAWGGGDSLEPFLEREDRGAFLWCRSTNAGAGDLQSLRVGDARGEGRPLYEWLAIRAIGWNARGNLGLVVGATDPEALGRVRELCPDMPILAPGVGAQGGNLEQAVARGVDASGRLLVVAVSRSVLYASADPSDFAQAARRQALALRERINALLALMGHGW